MMAGINKVAGRKAAVAVIGDSTFFHSGVTPLIDARYNESAGPRHRARQPHHGDDRATRATPGPGCTPTARRGRRSTSQRSARASACAARRSTRSTTRCVDVALKARARRPRPRRPGRARRPASLMTRERPSTVAVDDERCNLCGLCLDLGCPALVAGEVAVTITDDCTGCGVCVAVCGRGALALEPRRSSRRARVNGTTTVSLAGVGGQGIILGAAMLANAAMADGLDVKASEVKGMAQRGGSVLSTVRFGTPRLLAGRPARRRGHRHRAARGPPWPRPARAARHARLRDDAHRSGQRAARREGVSGRHRSRGRGARGPPDRSSTPRRWPRGRQRARRQRRPARRRQPRASVLARRLGARPRGRRPGEDPRRQPARVRPRARRRRRAGGLP